MRIFHFLTLFSAISVFVFGAEVEVYDPLRVAKAEIISHPLEIRDAKRDRVILLRVYLPISEKTSPVILFSHGLGGSKDNNPYIGEHWAKRGYVVVFVQHAGSDEDVWKKVPPGRRAATLGAAASFENAILRGQDIPAVIDGLTHWNDAEGHLLRGRMDLGHIGMSGHSFGANTTQSIAGQSVAGGRRSFREPRVSAAVMMSPGPPAAGDPAAAFAPVTIPCLLMTGTLDDSPVGRMTPEDRLKVFPALSAAPAWQVVFDGGDHKSFGDRNRDGAGRHHRAILALTTAFWDANLRGDPLAKSWLNGEAARSVLAPADRWERNVRTK